MMRFSTFNPNEMMSEMLYDVYLYDENYPKPTPDMKLAKITIPERILNYAVDVLKKQIQKRKRHDFGIFTHSIDHQIIRQNSKNNFDQYLKSRRFTKKIDKYAKSLKLL